MYADIAHWIYTHKKGITLVKTMDVGIGKKKREV